MSEKKSRRSSRILSWPITKPIPDPQNARVHSEEQIEQLAKSLGEFGQVKPIIVDEDGSILAGHGTLAGAKRLGWLKVRVLVVEGLTPEQKRAYRIADNQIALNSSWDFDLLKASMAELKLVEFDLESIGFTIPEIEELTAPKLKKKVEKSAAVEKSRNHHVRCPKCGHKFPIE